MAYAKRSLKKKTTKKRSSMKRKAPKAKVTSRGRAQSSASHRQTGYARALLDPRDGPLVGVPQFVPVDTHRVRTRAIGVVNTVGGSARIFFNPCRMGASNASAVKVWAAGTTKYTGTINDAVGSNETFHSNAPYTVTDFQSTSAANVSTIDNGDGVKCRVVGAMIRVCNVSAANTRGGVFTALHEPHHKTLEGFDLAALSKNSKTLIRPAGDGGYISLLYRPVKPEEVEEWQISPYVVPGQQSLSSGHNDPLDGTAADAFPGYMAIDFQGEPNSTLHVEAYAIIEYAGETVTALSRPVSAGGGKAGKPADVPPATKDAAAKEQFDAATGMDATPSTLDPFATLPNTPARVRATTVPATPGDDVHMEIADLRRSVASNTRQIRRNAMDMVRQGRGSALRTRHLHPDFTNIPSRGSAAGTRRTPRNPNSRSYSFKPSQGRIWNASFKPSRGQKRRR